MSAFVVSLYVHKHSVLSLKGLIKSTNLFVKSQNRTETKTNGLEYFNNVFILVIGVNNALY